MSCRGPAVDPSETLPRESGSDARPKVKPKPAADRSTASDQSKDCRSRRTIASSNLSDVSDASEASPLDDPPPRRPESQNARTRAQSGSSQPPAPPQPSSSRKSSAQSPLSYSRSPSNASPVLTQPALAKASSASSRDANSSTASTAASTAAPAPARPAGGLPHRSKSVSGFERRKHSSMVMASAPDRGAAWVDVTPKKPAASAEEPTRGRVGKRPGGMFGFMSKRKAVSKTLEARGTGILGKVGCRIIIADEGG